MFESYEDNQCQKFNQNKIKVGDLPKCGSRPGAPEMPGGHCKAENVNDKFSKLESEFPERFHNFLQISEKTKEEICCRIWNGRNSYFVCSNRIHTQV